MKKSAKKIYIIFSLFIPIITSAMVIISFYKFENLLMLEILPYLLKFWLLTLMINIVYEIIRYVKRRPLTQKEEIIVILYFAFSITLFLICSFIVLFTNSILLGGFHTT